MPLTNQVIHAAVQAFAEALGASGAAHGLALSLWLSPERSAAAAGAMGLGTGLAVVVAARGRLLPALAEGGRALRRPAVLKASSRARDALTIGWIGALSALGTWALDRAGVAVPAAPRTVAVGLGLTGLAMLAAAYFVWGRDEPRSRPAPGPPADAPSLAGATLAAAAHTFGVWPGVSRPAAAAAVLLALGVKPVRALEIALLATVPFWWSDVVTALPDLPALGAGRATAIALFAFLGAYGAVALLRALAMRRALAALPVWMLPLACALFAYGRAV